MIFFGYLALALVLGVGSAVLAVVASQASSGVRLFMRCLRWGVATGAVTGAVVGACLPLTGSLRGDAGALLGFMLVGAVYGAIVALIPTLIGAAVVTDLLRQRHPHPSSEESVHSDLTSVFGVMVAVLDGIVLVPMIASGPDLSSAAIALSLIVVGNACVVLMLWRARRSIGRLWFTAAG